MNKDLRVRLDKLLRMLSSNRDGEILGAVAAIGKLLKSSKLDWHDLADTIAGKVIQVTEVIDGGADARSWINAAEKVLNHSNDLTEREREFIEDMKSHFKLYPRYEPSTKQTNWFLMIYRRFYPEGMSQ